MFCADAHRGDGNRFIVRADAKLTASQTLDTSAQMHGLALFPQTTNFHFEILQFIRRE
jgi:hypothetical protein